MNVFADDITIEDDMSVLVRYDNGANMTYHLTAYSVRLSSFTLYPFTSSALSHLLSTPSSLPHLFFSLSCPIIHSSLYIRHLPYHVILRLTKLCLSPAPLYPYSASARRGADDSHGKDTGSCSTVIKADWSSK